MFSVEIDLVLRYVPPMVDRGQGIRLTRTVELPFPPNDHIALFSASWEGWETFDQPLGFPLKEIIWELDRNCFLADTHMSVTGLPIAVIPREIRSLLRQGWRFGSYNDVYGPKRRGRRRLARVPIIRCRHWDDDQAAQWETKRDASRPKAFNTILKAVTATMAQLGNNCRVAYAMSKTSTFVDLPDDPLHRELDAGEKRFFAATQQYDALTSVQRWNWSQSVQRRYPRLVEGVRSADHS